MKKAFPIFLLALGGVVVYLYMSGQLAGVTDNVDTSGAGAAISKGSDKAQQTGNEIYAQPWFWYAAFAIAGTALIRWLWGQMPGPIRAALIIGVTIAAVLFVMSVKR